MCYGDHPAYCTTYGRFYNWVTAMSVCPSGWHLPSKEEWYALTNYVGGNNIFLMANGFDRYGFSALLDGWGRSDGYYGYFFYDAGDYGRWWGTSEGYYAFSVYNRDLFHYDKDGFRINRKYDILIISVRCVKN